MARQLAASALGTADWREFSEGKTFLCWCE